jgi:hypothetical protein
LLLRTPKRERNRAIGNQQRGNGVAIHGTIGVATRFKPGNPGRPKNAAPISQRRARRLAKLAIVAQAAGTSVPELMRLLGTPHALPRDVATPPGPDR